MRPSTKLTKARTSAKATKAKKAENVPRAAGSKAFKSQLSHLSNRALNRALLARQLLLDRQPLPVPQALEHLCGLQAQVPQAPYVALWSRLHAFDPEALSQLISQRRAVRLGLFRGTLHLVTARDCQTLRPLLQPVLERMFQTGSPFGKRLAGVDLDAVVAAGRALIDEMPRSNAQLRKLLHPRWPDRDPEALAYAVQYLLPSVQVPPRGLWKQSGLPLLTSAQAWLRAPLAPKPLAKKLVLRYLAAFGPASAADLQAWSGSPGLRAVIEGLRGRLRVVHDGAGRELFDLPGAPRPDPDLPAPVRFLPEYDNILLGHADRSRIVADRHQGALFIGVPTFLIDGFVAGAWKLKLQRGRATLRLTPYQRFDQRDKIAVTAEATALLDFVASDVSRHDVEWDR
jgi:hypothetical protein